MFSLNSLNSVTKMILFLKRLLYSNSLSPVSETGTLLLFTETQLTENTVKLILIHASVIFSDSLNSLNSLNLRKVQFYLGKTPVITRAMIRSADLIQAILELFSSSTSGLIKKPTKEFIERDFWQPLNTLTTYYAYAENIQTR